MKDSIWYKSPKVWERKYTTIKTHNVERKVMVIIEDILKDEYLKIPISPYIHPLGLQRVKDLPKGELIRSILVYLPTLLHKRADYNIIEFSYKELMKKFSCSEHSIVKAITLLIEHKFIYRIKQKHYFISPEFAFFGNQVDWGICLKEIKEGKSLKEIFENLRRRAVKLPCQENLE